VPCREYQSRRNEAQGPVNYPAVEPGPAGVGRERTTLRPFVSAVVIFFNEQRFLGEAIASVYAQTYRDWELLLVDDGSNDSSSETARAYANRDSARVRYLAHPGHANLGEGAARNLGVNAATGEWIAFLDGDDVWLPDRLERGVALALAHPEADMIYGKTVYWHSWDRQSPVPDRIQPHYFRANRVVPPPELLRRYLSLRAAYPCMGSLLVRRRAFAAIGGFEDSFRGIGQDLVFFAKFCLTRSVYVSDECWDRYRQHAESITARAATPEATRRALRAYLCWLERFIEQQGIRDAELHAALRGAMRRNDLGPRHWRSRIERIQHRVATWPFG
jgi:glycosyltransferase involved in cell wall biosynthesis